MSNIELYLSGQALYGDDFKPDQIAAWYSDEAEGYAQLVPKDHSTYAYDYHAWNNYHGYRHLPGAHFKNVLGFGSAFGDELLPIISRIGKITIVDPSSAFDRDSIGGAPTTYVRPAPDGRLPFPDNQFDLITCLGALHHIPNVSFIVAELARTLKAGCFMLLREPIVSMGDWRYPRRGLTKRERGIPFKIMNDIIGAAGFRVVRRSFCGFPIVPKLFAKIRPDVYNSQTASWIDAKLASAFAWNLNYHPRTLIERFRPTSIFFVLQKPIE